MAIGPMSSLGKSFPYLLYPTIGLAAGWGWGEMRPRQNDGPDDPADSISAHSEDSSTRERQTYKEIFAETRKAVDIAELAEKQYESSIHSLVKDWSEAELLAVLNEAALLPEATLRYDSIARELVAELAIRNPDGALEWVLTQPAMAQTRFAGALLNGWGPDRFDEALAVVKKHPDLFASSFGFRQPLPHKLMADGLTDGMNRGPEAFISRLKEFLDLKVSPWSISSASSVPEGFDFAAVLSSSDFKDLKLESTQKYLLRQWAERDREAAYEWVVENQGIQNITSLQPSAWDLPGAASFGFAQWAMGKIETATPEQRDMFLKQLESNARQTMVDMNLWIQSATTQEQRDTLGRGAAFGVLGGQERDVESGLGALEKFPDLESRLTALENVPIDTSVTNRGRYPEWEKKIRDRLTEWGTDATRADAIVKHLKGDKSTTPNP